MVIKNLGLLDPNSPKSPDPDSINLTQQPKLPKVYLAPRQQVPFKTVGDWARLYGEACRHRYVLSTGILLCRELS